MARGRDAEKYCSQGCRVPETLNQISQQCYVTNSLRINRRNAISNYLAHSLEQRGYLVHKEPIFRAPDAKKLKPDLVAYGIDHSLVIDAQVINDQLFLTTAYENKINK